MENSRFPTEQAIKKDSLKHHFLQKESLETLVMGKKVDDPELTTFIEQRDRHDRAMFILTMDLGK